MIPLVRRGEVWLVDLGMAAKTRPCAVVSVPFRDDERALVAIVPHTTALRGGRFEVAVKLPWLQAGVFDVQGLRNVPCAVFLRRLGILDSAQIDQLVQAIKTWLSIP